MEQSLGDDNLLKRISQSDERAFEELFNNYFQYLHNVAYNRLRSKEAADDIIQDIFADIWKNREKLDIHTSVKSYLFQAVRNKVYKFIRHQSVRDKEMYIQCIYDEYYAQNSFSQSNETVEANELEALVSKHLNDLPVKSRNIFYMSRKEHYTYNEIAEELNCSSKTVEYHIGKTLQYLRLHLKDYVAILFPLIIFLF